MAKDKEINIEINDSAQSGAGAESPSAGEKQAAEKAATPVEQQSAEDRLAAAEDKLLRTMAEFDNYRKRTAQQFEQVIQSANEKILLEMLEIVDNLERALQHSDDNGQTESLRKGMELILNQMQSVLRKHRVEPIESLGQPFDPNLHDAMMQTASDTYAEGLVAMEIGRGYKIGDRILRHARVAVSTGAPQHDEQNPESEA